MRGVVDPSLGGEPAAACQRGPPHEPGGPDVAEYPALVADRIGQPGLFEQLVELGSMLARAPSRGPLAILASVSDAFAAVPSTATRMARSSASGISSAKRVRDVEAVEQPVADQVEIRRHGCARPAVERPQRLEHARRDRRSMSSSVCARRSCRIAAIIRASCSTRPPTRASAAHQAEQLGRRYARSSRRRARASRRSGRIAAAVKRMCW